MGDIEWKSELKKIEREFDGLPPDHSAVATRVRRSAERRTLERQVQRAIALGTWGRVLLVLALCAAINFWPYAHSCGVGLFTYLGAEALIAVGGLWAAVSTWRTHRALAHSLALAMVLWGLALTAAQVLPRVGYAKIDGPRAPEWSCGGSPAGPLPPPSGQLPGPGLP